jgi:hypothetical protein
MRQDRHPWSAIYRAAHELPARSSNTAAAVRERDYQVVFCNYDVGLLVLSRRRDEFAPAIVPYAAHEIVERSFDKLAFTRTAEAAGLAVPHTEEATEAALAGWSGPVVVKARIHVPTRYETRASRALSRQRHSSPTCASAMPSRCCRSASRASSARSSWWRTTTDRSSPRSSSVATGRGPRRWA